MRFNEMQLGVHVSDEAGNTMGISKTAGKYAVLQSAFTRMVLPAPILLFPPFLMRVCFYISLFCGSLMVSQTGGIKYQFCSYQTSVKSTN
jgi:hypothetical protein